MPVTKRKLPSGKYRVSTPNQVHARATSKKNAIAQEHILNAVEHSNWRPTGKGVRKIFGKRKKKHG